MPLLLLLLLLLTCKSKKMCRVEAAEEQRRSRGAHATVCMCLEEKRRSKEVTRIIDPNSLDSSELSYWFLDFVSEIDFSNSTTTTMTTLLLLLLLAMQEKGGTRARPHVHARACAPCEQVKLDNLNCL